MRGMLAAARDCAKLVVGLGLLGVICLGWAPCAWILCKLRPADDGRFGRRAITVYIRFYLRALEAIGAMRFDIGALDALEGPEVPEVPGVLNVLKAGDDGGPLIIAPNHPRLIDAFLVVSRLTNVVCIMKNDINDNVFLGQAARLAGYISNDSAVQMIRDSVRTLKRGNHLLLFPEGTRTVREPVNPMTGAVGLIASRAGVPVQTVFIECDSPYLRKGWPLLRRPRLPIHFRVRLGQRFDPPKDPRAFTAMLEQYFVETLAPAGSTNGSAHPAASDLASPIATTTPSFSRDVADVVAANPENLASARPALTPLTTTAVIGSHST